MLIIVTPKDLDRTVGKDEVKTYHIVSVPLRTLERASTVLYTDGESVRLIKSRYTSTLKPWMSAAALEYYATIPEYK